MRMSYLSPFFSDIDSEYAFNIDIWEKDGTYFYEAELAGVNKDDIELDVKDGILKITANRKKVEDAKYIYSTITNGKFSRSFYLPKDCDADAISAEYKEGMLRLTVPNSPKHQPKKIEISTS